MDPRDSEDGDGESSACRCRAAQHRRQQPYVLRSALVIFHMEGDDELHVSAKLGCRDSIHGGQCAELPAISSGSGGGHHCRGPLGNSALNWRRIVCQRATAGKPDLKAVTQQRHLARLKRGRRRRRWRRGRVIRW